MKKDKPKSVKPEPRSSRSECRWIHDLHNIHKGSEIWVLGSGWSIDEFPDDFFRDKLAIAHRVSIVAFPYCNYVWTGSNKMKIPSTRGIPKALELEEEPGFKKIILGLSEGRKPSGIGWLGANWRDPIYMKKHHVKKLKQFKHKIGNVAKDIVEGRDCCFLCCQTTVHFSIEAAIMLGASKVTLVGCSHREQNGQSFAQKRGFSDYYPSADSGEIINIHSGKPLRLLWPRVRLATGSLVQTFGSYGISIRRYFFETGYERIPTLKDLEGKSKC